VSVKVKLKPKIRTAFVAGERKQYQNDIQYLWNRLSVREPELLTQCELLRKRQIAVGGGRYVLA